MGSVICNSLVTINIIVGLVAHLMRMLEWWQGVDSIITNVKDAERDHGAARARADLLRRAEALGVKPFTLLADFAGDPEMTADFDVDGFLQQVREDRDRISSRSPE